MQISLIIVLIVAELLLVLTGLCITLTIFLLRKPKATEEKTDEVSAQPAEDELDAIELSNNYIDFLEQAMHRNTQKTQQQKNIEADIAKEESDTADATDDLETGEATEEESANTSNSPAPDEAQSKLLLIRDQFLILEKTAAEKSEHEIHFWESIYDGMKDLLEQFPSTKTASTETSSSTETVVVESKEKVFYIETQGKKIDGEVNKLKDIIYEQENALSSMKKAMQGAEEEHPGDSESLKILKEQMEAIERQLNDSKMCMEVLEMENNRLQEEVDKMDGRHDALFEETDNSSSEESGSVIDLDQMKEVVEEQEAKIQQLIDTIESLEIDASQADKLKETLGDFTRSSKEMMSCICILEEENERLKSSSEADDDNTETTADSAAASSEDTAEIAGKISQLEEELIKKDVAYAQLQDEFSSMETEYLAMYEAMHGDNS